MKQPKYGCVTMQDMINAGINAFAAQLLVESYADETAPHRKLNTELEPIMLMARTHQDVPIFIILTKHQPKPEDFHE
jgi:hypothetical protein